MYDKHSSSYPAAQRRLRLGFVGGGRGSLVAQWHANGARLSGRWEIVAGALSSDPETARRSGKDWLIAEERSYSDFSVMAREEAARTDGIDAVAICTPNFLHRPVAEAFMAAGIDIICDKPVALTRQDCAAMAEIAENTGVVFAVTYPYAYHPMVVQAACMVAEGAIGSVRQVMVEYAQDGRAGAFDPSVKQLAWRLDPAKGGRTATTGDIGTHAVHMMEFVTGQRIAKLRADFHVCGGEKPMEDTSFINFRLENGAPGVMWLSQAAIGNTTGLRLRVYGEKGGIEWDHEMPEHLHVNMRNAPRQTITRGAGAGMHPRAERMIRLPRGHGEALSDAWANLYTEAAVAIEARRDRVALEDGLLNLPLLAEGARGVDFFHAAADSNDAGGAWTDL
ncbi:Gfo/Idh/MocA family protein [Tropicimonas marinistellae]|uniref:Gfo/Idh/MocA family protein n=1 Tax=Tropicimonas marinistellae TaxID=1739787 RepID=UPI0008325503|nr:Gfo/Idh/MocA family oxidoreductase [Tropicimonas marinistellae]